MKTMTRPFLQKGFTIVELIVVIVAIAILASIAVISYTNVTKQAKVVSIESDITSAVKQIETMKFTAGNTLYPSSIAGTGLNQNIKYFYAQNSNTYCVELTDVGVTYSATSKATNPAALPCTENGLIGWWKMNGDGSDSGPLKLSSTASGTTPTTSASGVAGNALTFSAATTSSIQVPSNTAFNDAKTFSFWIRPTSWSSATASAIITKRSSSADGFFISYINSNDVLAVDCGMSAGGNRWPTNYKPSLNTWAHVVITCSSEDGLKLYVDGALRDQRTNVDRSNIPLSTTDLFIGKDSINTSSTYHWNGSMDDVRIFNRAINPEEVQSLYANSAR